MELGTFVMCQISKMYFSHAFPHSSKKLAQKSFLMISTVLFNRPATRSASQMQHLSFVRSLSGKNERKNNENVLHVTGIRLYLSFGVTVLSWTSNGARRILPCTKQHSQNGKSKSTILIAIRICTVVHHPFGKIEP